MSNSPIFDQLVADFASKGAVYEEFIRFTIPEFDWDPNRPVVQLDRQTYGKGIRLGKRYTIAKSFSTELPESVRKPALIEVWKPQPEASEPISTLLQDYVEKVREKVAETYPDAVITNVSVKPNLSDDTLSLVVEGLHPTVKPLSERNTAQPME